MYDIYNSVIGDVSSSERGNQRKALSRTTGNVHKFMSMMMMSMMMMMIMAMMIMMMMMIMIMIMVAFNEQSHYQCIIMTKHLLLLQQPNISINTGGVYDFPLHTCCT